MPATRSRTEHWLDSLRRIAERTGSLEISVARQQDDEQPGPADGESAGVDLVWRVRLLQVADDSLLVEPPAAFGQPVHLAPGTRLVGAMVIGQNRWMFHTTVSRAGADGLMLEMPESVERCSRRNFYRISTAKLNLPTVNCWPLLNPATVIAAETANRLRIEDLLSGVYRSDRMESAEGAEDSFLLPEVGPPFHASLVNLSGGGLGLSVTRDEASALEDRPHLWLRVSLTPYVPIPVAVTARIAHTRMDSAQNTYVGLAFEFSHNPAHRTFVHGLFTGYVESVQRAQQSRAA